MNKWFTECNIIGRCLDKVENANIVAYALIWVPNPPELLAIIEVFRGKHGCNFFTVTLSSDPALLDKLDSELGILALDSFKTSKLGIKLCSEKSA